MNKYLNIKKSLAFMAIVAFTFSACKKIVTPVPMGDAGQTLVKILGAGTPYAVLSKPIDFVSTPTKILAVDLRRDVPNNTELNKTMTVTIKDDTAKVKTANPAYIHLPTAWYTLQIDGGTKTGGQGGTFTMTFKPGEFGRSIFVTIPNATLLDPSSLYALAFTLTTADANGIITAQKTIIIEIGAKNIYDGIYSYVSGFVQRYSGPGPTNPICCDGLTGDLNTANPDVIMATTGATKVAIPVAGTAGTWTWSGGVSGVAGIDGFSITVDPATNLTTEAATGNATLTNWAGHVNKYDPGTKTFTLAWTWNPVTTTREYQVVVKYKGPR